MKFKKELLILPIVLLFVYLRPRFLVSFSSTFLGKLLMLGLIVLATLKNKWYGVSAAVLSVIITEMGIIEGMDHMEDENIGSDDDFNFEADALDYADGADGADGDDGYADGDADGDAVGDADGNEIDDMDMTDKGILASIDEMNLDDQGGDIVSNDTDEDMEENFTLMKKFGVMGGNERLYMDEKLRAKSSNDCIY